LIREIKNYRSFFELDLNRHHHGILVVVKGIYLGIRRCPLFNQTTLFDHKLDRMKRGFSTASTQSTRATSRAAGWRPSDQRERV